MYFKEIKRKFSLLYLLKSIYLPFLEQYITSRISEFSLVSFPLSLNNFLSQFGNIRMLVTMARLSWGVGGSHSTLGTLVGGARCEASARGPLWASETGLSTKEKQKPSQSYDYFQGYCFSLWYTAYGQNKEEAGDSNVQHRRRGTAGQLLQLWRHSSCVADTVLVLWLGVRADPLRWEIQVQDIGPPETSWPHIISIIESSPRDLCLHTKNQLHSITSKLQCWTPHAKQLPRQEHNPTHYQRGCLKSY